MKEEKIIEKIKKVLELSKNNPSQEEAQAAALKAQAMMAQYHIQLADVEEIEDVEDIEEKRIYVGAGNKWKFQLANIVADNFRCKTYCYGRTSIVFYGYKTDTEIAAETFKYLFKTGNISAKSYYHKLRYEAVKNDQRFDGSGIVNSFLWGFMDGVRTALEKQCTALMIVVPREVEDAYSDIDFDHTIKSGITIQYNSNGESARQAGIQKGRDSVSARQLEGAI